ncbi:hypothetical protein GCM10028807_00570 [Spirosoma daeguense]
MTKLNKTILPALGSGLIGATVLTAVHETARQFIAEAPRADVLGERAIKKGLKKADIEAPADDELYYWTLGGDLISNALYYSLIGLAKPKQSLLVGTALGLAAGAGAVGLPGPMGLGSAPTSRTPATAAMTVAWYLIGGIATASVYQILKRKLR